MKRAEHRFSVHEFPRSELDKGDDRRRVRRWCDRACAVNPNNVEAVALLGRLRRQEGRYDDADARGLREAEPAGGFAAAVAGARAPGAGTGHPDDAIEALRASIDADPRSLDAGALSLRPSTQQDRRRMRWRRSGRCKRAGDHRDQATGKETCGRRPSPDTSSRMKLRPVPVGPLGRGIGRARGRSVLLSSALASCACHKPSGNDPVGPGLTGEQAASSHVRGRADRARSRLGAPFRPPPVPCGWVRRAVQLASQAQRRARRRRPR